MARRKKIKDGSQLIFWLAFAVIVVGTLTLIFSKPQTQPLAFEGDSSSVGRIKPCLGF